MLTILLLLACGDGSTTGTQAPPSAPGLAAPEKAAPVPPPPPPARPSPPPVAPGTAKHAIVLVIDTLRADALERADTPHIDGLARRGRRVARAWSAGTWTVPSVVSLFTGMPIRQHGWDEPTGRLGQYPPLPGVSLLAEVFHAAGFKTLGLYSNGYLAEELGFDRGFDLWQRGTDKAMPGQLKKALQKHTGPEDRLFLYLHLLGPHSTLKPSPEAMKRWGVDPSWLNFGEAGLSTGAVQRKDKEGIREVYTAAYHAVIEDTDAVVGQLLRELGPLADEAAIVVTSDHGELLGEHGWAGHGHWVYEELTHVPFIGVNVGPLPETLGTASIPQLLTDAVGLDHRWPTAASAALPLVSQREGKLALSPDGHTKGMWLDTLSVYDLATDPGEEHPRPDDGTLGAARAAWEATVPAGAAGRRDVELREGTREELRVLGYVE